MIPDLCSLITEGSESGNKCLQALQEYLQHRMRHLTWMDLFCLFIFFLCVHAYACTVYRFYNRNLVHLLPNSSPKIDSNSFQEEPELEIQPSMSPEPAEESESEKSEEIELESESVEEKPVWRPKPKKKRRRTSRQGW